VVVFVHCDRVAGMALSSELHDDRNCGNSANEQQDLICDNLKTTSLFIPVLIVVGRASAGAKESLNAAALTAGRRPGISMSCQYLG
jgi:hypothetical protein